MIFWNLSIRDKLVLNIFGRIINLETILGAIGRLNTVMGYV
jgi:hypothetical protein